ncbi:MAG: hypothetical protein ABI706_04520 [Ilumatobacteraceae bacterium]
MGASTFSLSFNRFMMVLMTPMLAGPRHCSAEVGEQTLMVRMGVGGWRELTLSLDDPGRFIDTTQPATA